MTRSARLYRGLCLPAIGLAAVLTLLACGGGSSPDLQVPPPPQGGGPFGLDARTPLAQLAFPTSTPNPGAVPLEPAFPNLVFARPVYLTAAPDGTDWIYVVEQRGRIWVFPNDDSVQTADTFLDLRPVVGGPVTGTQNEEGLLGLAFDPDYGTNGVFYVYYSSVSGPQGRRSVISRFTATFPQGQAPTANANSEEIILEVPQFQWNHNAGMMDFGPDGFLYVAFGDGGGAGDPQDHGQDPSTFLGSLIRIDPRNPPAGRTYGIPTDNPFVGEAGMLEEIWAYGLRNPWRFSFDRNTGTLYLGDVGQGAREEVDIIRRGGNYAWPIWEGNAVFDGGIPANQFDMPILDYGTGLGRTVIGGYVYRGTAVPSLNGLYVYGDNASGRIWAMNYDGQQVVTNTEINTLGNVCSFGEDGNAELYAVSNSGPIRRFVEPNGVPPPAFPDTLSATGMFTNLVDLTPAAGLVEYDVNAPLWSDNAAKRRWIGVPGTARITFSNGVYQFPVDTILVKHFELELTVGDPSTRRRLETRVLINHATGWAGYTYRWNAAQTDATLLADALDETFVIQDPSAPGGQRDQVWRYPSRTDCLQCHTATAGRILGFRTEQLNRDFAYPNATDNQLRTLNHIGLFTSDIGDHAQYSAWADPRDAGASVTARARAYLQVNCAQCHLPGGPAPSDIDLRHDTAAAGMNAIGVPAQLGNLGLPNPEIIDAFSKENSVLWLRLGTTDHTRMPKLGSNLVDDPGMALVGQWIDQGP